MSDPATIELLNRLSAAEAENVQLRKAISGARAQLHAVHSVNQVPFLKGAIGAALQALEAQ